MKQYKDKRCKSCGKTFTPRKIGQKVCDINCAIKYSRLERAKEAEKKQKTKDRQKKEQLKTKSQLLNELQSIFNRYIRLRDAHQPCISCGRHHKGQYHAGHYKTRGANPELRFCEDNVFKQCSACNNHLSGHIHGFREGIITRIGEERLAWVEGAHEMPHWSREEIAEMKKTYRQKIKDIESYFPELQAE
jgi:predicted GIY-YIG superfamily endonuclease